MKITNLSSGGNEHKAEPRANHFTPQQ